MSTGLRRNFNWKGGLPYALTRLPCMHISGTLSWLLIDMEYWGNCGCLGCIKRLDKQKIVKKSESSVSTLSLIDFPISGSCFEICSFLNERLWQKHIWLNKFYPSHRVFSLNISPQQQRRNLEQLPWLHQSDILLLFNQLT